MIGAGSCSRALSASVRQNLSNGSVLAGLLRIEFPLVHAEPRAAPRHHVFPPERTIGDRHSSIGCLRGRKRLVDSTRQRMDWYIQAQLSRTVPRVESHTVALVPLANATFVPAMTASIPTKEM